MYEIEKCIAYLKPYLTDPKYLPDGLLAHRTLTAMT